MVSQVKSDLPDQIKKAEEAKKAKPSASYDKYSSKNKGGGKWTGGWHQKPYGATRPPLADRPVSAPVIKKEWNSKSFQFSASGAFICIPDDLGEGEVGSDVTVLSRLRLPGFAQNAKAVSLEYLGEFFARKLEQPSGIYEGLESLFDCGGDGTACFEKVFPLSKARPLPDDVMSATKSVIQKGREGVIIDIESKLESLRRAKQFSEPHSAKGVWMNSRHDSTKGVMPNFDPVIFYLIATE